MLVELEPAGAPVLLLPDGPVEEAPVEALDAAGVLAPDEPGAGAELPDVLKQLVAAKNDSLNRRNDSETDKRHTTRLHNERSTLTGVTLGIMDRDAVLSV